MDRCGGCTHRVPANGWCTAIGRNTRPDQPACRHYGDAAARAEKEAASRSRSLLEYEGVMNKDSGGTPQEGKGKLLGFKAALEDAGDTMSYLQLEEGVTTVTILGDDVELRENKFGKEQYYFKARIDKTEGVWTITKNSPLAKQVLTHLAAGRRKLQVVRAGTGQDTKYSIKAASK